MNVTIGHWVFAGCFIIAFVIALMYSYMADKRKSPTYFTGSSKFLLGVVVVVMLLVVIKILYRLA